MSSTAPRPIPLRPDYSAVEREWRRSFVQASTIKALVTVQAKSEADVLAEWSNDPTVGLITRGAVTPLKAADLPGSILTAFKALAPRAASIAVLELGTVVDLTVATQYGFPLPQSLTEAKFVEEGKPVPVGHGVFASMPLGPVRKIALIAGLSNELNDATVGKASSIIAHVLEVVVGRGLDAVLFSAAGASVLAPAGLLYNVTPIGGSASMLTDLAALAAEISASGVNPESVVFIAAAAQAMAIKLAAGPLFNHRVVSANITPGTVIATAGLAVAGEGEPRIEVSKFADMHQDDEPTNIGTSGSPAIVAAPAVSMFQSATFALKCIARIAWAAAPGSVAVVNGATW